MNKQIVLILFLFMALSLTPLAGCLNSNLKPLASQPQSGSTDNQSENGCEVDCWRLLHPGVTTEAQFKLLVEKANPENFKQLEIGELNQDDIGYSWFDGKTGFRLAAYFSDDIVDKVEIFPNLTIEESFEYFGEPDSYSAFLAPGEREHLWVDFYFDESMFITILDEKYDISELTDTENCKIDISGRHPVLIIQIFDPEKPSEYLAGFNPDWRRFPWESFKTMRLTRHCDK